MSVESAITFFLAIFVFGITPGPGVFAILARSMAFGANNCFFLALGMTISDIIYLVMACLGLAVIAENWSGLFAIISWIGAAYLCYLGWTLITAKPEIDDDVTMKGHGVMGLIQGFLISASNPKVILFYIAFLPTFIDLTVLSGQDVVLAGVLTLVALMIGLMLIAACASKVRLLLKTPLATKRMNQGAGAIMIAAGAYLVLRRV